MVFNSLRALLLPFPLTQNRLGIDSVYFIVERISLFVSWYTILSFRSQRVPYLF